MTTGQAIATAPTVAQARTRAMTSAEWIAFFMRDDHEQDKATPGPYEQGSGILWRETLEEGRVH